MKKVRPILIVVGFGTLVGLWAMDPRLLTIQSWVSQIQTWYLRQSPLLQGGLLVLIVLFVLSLVVGSVLILQLRHRIKQSSSSYLAVVKANETFSFERLTDKITLRQTYSSKAKLDRTTPREVIDDEFRGRLEYYQDLLSKAQYNQDQWTAYQSVFADELQRSKNTAAYWFEIWIEQRLIHRLKKPKPVTDISCFVHLTYTSPKGRNHYYKKHTFSAMDVKHILSEALQYRERVSTQEYLRAKERSKMTTRMRFKILKRDDYRCQICGASQADGAKLHIDHIVPVAKGGKTEPDNLHVLCDRCNLGKGTISL